MRSLARVVGSCIIPVIPFFSVFELSSANAAPKKLSVQSYYPHWVSRDGNVTDAILKRLKPGTTIAVHHAWDLQEMRRILNAPGKFKLSWYVEANLREKNDPTPVGMPVSKRVIAAKEKQLALQAEYGQERFSGLIELDGARDKYEGQLRGRGNSKNDWVSDAKAAKSAGFRYVAKSPTVAHVKALRQTIGADFVPHIVFEDVTGSLNDPNPGYREDAKMLAKAGEPVTLIIHEGAYGDFAETPLAKAHDVLKKDFDLPNVEAYWGRTHSDMEFVKLKGFATPIEPLRSPQEIDAVPVSKKPIETTQPPESAE